jgi:hypothetical protein
MIRQIAPQFFTTDIPGTVGYYKDKLGFECLGTWQDPPVYAIVARDQHAIHFRCAAPPTPNPDKYADELLDAYLDVEDADALYAEYAANGVEFAPGLKSWSRAASQFRSPCELLVEAHGVRATPRRSLMLTLRRGLKRNDQKLSLRGNQCCDEESPR